MSGRRRSEDELRRWEHVFEHAQWGIVVGSADGKTLELMNPAFARMHDYTVDELRGRPIASIFPPDAHDDLAELVREAHRDGHAVWEGDHVKKDGTRFPVRLDVSAVKDALGKVLYRVVHVEDLSGPRRAETLLRESEERFRDLFESAPVAYVSSHMDGHIRRVNQAAVELLGYSREELIGRSVLELYGDSESGRAKAERINRQLRAGEEVHGEELEMRRADGELVWVSLSVRVVRDSGGNPVERRGIVEDIGERKRAEQTLRESEARLAAVVGSAMDAIVAIDAERVVKLWNAAAEDVFRSRAADVLGTSFDRFATDALRQLLGRSIRAFERSGSGKRYLWAPEGLSAKRASGDEFPIEATISKAGAGDQKLYTLILRDLDERLRAERRLQRLQAENVYLREREASAQGFEEIVGESPALTKVLDEVRVVGPTDSTVLLTGDTGTGKELIARAIHRRSGRRDKPLVAVNCAALPGGVIESELFGHEKGAFTGAVGRKIGRFEMADGGTLFLDEIADLPLDLQAKLLRVLQEGELERLGATTTLKVDVRVIAATNRELERAVEQAEFRADLYYRLNVFPIHLPPLAEREGDLELLVAHFVDQLSRRMGKQIDSIPKKVLAALASYPWPGNVRELRNVVERAVILSRGPELELGDRLPRSPAKPDSDRLATLEEQERRHITEALERTGWRVSGPRGAARLLDIKPTTLSARMKKLGIERPGG